MTIKFFKKFKTALSRRPEIFATQQVSFPVWTFDLQDEIDNQSIRERALSLYQEQSKNNKPGLVKNGYQTEYFRKGQSDNHFDDLLTVIESRARLITDREYRTHKYWLVFYSKDTEHRSHNHVGPEAPFHFYPLSAVYYPSCTSDSEPLVFDDLLRSSGKLEVPVKPNQLVIFNSFLYHRVEKCQSDTARIAFSCNLV